MSLTVHTIVKNEEQYIEYALRSVLDIAEKIFVFDTGSTDTTVSILHALQKEYPTVLTIEQKGDAGKGRHTDLRNEMIKRTTTDWFMILDGDEIWSEAGTKELVSLLQNEEQICLIAPFYLCVGDMHHTSKKGMYRIQGKQMHATPRVFRKQQGMHWSGDYDSDVVVNAQGDAIGELSDAHIMKYGFWHVSHLVRSSKDSETYTSGNQTRKDKYVPTYLWIGKPVQEKLPAVVQGTAVAANMSFGKAFIGFIQYVLHRVA